MAAFLLYRERIHWPALHRKVVEIDRTARFSSKAICWIVYSAFYTALTLPCHERLSQNSSSKWGWFGRMALLLQGTGLLMETVADHQKSRFKGRYRAQWCQEGLWSWSPHPNYLGEFVFWCGNYLAGLGAMTTLSSFSSLFRKSSSATATATTGSVNMTSLVMSTIGLLFCATVLRGAILSLRAKQERTYGDDPLFVQFQQTHWIGGPKPRYWKEVLRRWVTAERRGMPLTQNGHGDETKTSGMSGNMSANRDATLDMYNNSNSTNESINVSVNSK